MERQGEFSGLILGREERGEHHWRLRLLSPLSGGIDLYFRRQKAPRQVRAPDLFEEIEGISEKGKNASTSFLKEFRLIRGHPGIARHYSALKEAGVFFETLWRNLRHAEDFESIHALAIEAVAAFERGERPEVVHFKALYLFAKREGYPVKEEWVAQASLAESATVGRLLSEPVDGDQPSADEARQLLDSLKVYLRRSTDILVP